MSSKSQNIHGLVTLPLHIPLQWVTLKTTNINTYSEIASHNNIWVP
jgi:hypothetical protein